MNATINPYQKFPETKVKNDRIIISSTDPWTPKKFVDNHSSHSQYDTRVKGKHILLENPVKESRTTKERKAKSARREKNKERRRLGVMGRKEAKMRGVWRLRPEDAIWSKFLPLHHLWLGYISELMCLPPKPDPPDSSRLPSIPNPPAMQAKLVKADFHGSIIVVKEAKNACLVGCSGIVVHETEGTFKVVTQQNTMKVIPKHNSIFTFHLPIYAYVTEMVALPGLSTDPLIEFELYGNQFCFRSADRATRKFKAKETIEL